MLRTLLVLGLLVLVAMLAHPIVVSAQPIGARVLQAESQEIPNLPHTLERRLPPSHAAPPIDTTSDSENHLRTVARESLRALTIMDGPQGPISFELWNHNTNRAIEAVQELVKRRATGWPQTRLVTLRVTILQEYLQFLIHPDGLGHVVTEEDIHGAVVRVQTLHNMDTRERRVHWEQVLQLLGRLTVPENGQHNFRLVKLALALINQGEAMDVFTRPPETLDQIDCAFQKWDYYSREAINTWRAIVARGDNHDTAADQAQLLALLEETLVQYFRLLMKYRSSNPVTELDKLVAVEWAQALLEMDTKRMLHWKQVLELIQELRVGKVGLPIFLRVLNLVKS